MESSTSLSTYAVDPQYCGLVVADRSSASLATRLVDVLESMDCQGWVLQSPYHVIAVAQAGLHPELLFSALSSAHGTADAQTSIVGRLAGLSLRSGQPCMAFRIPAAAAVSEGLVAGLRQATDDEAIVLLDPFEDTVWAIAPSAPLLAAEVLAELERFEFDCALVVMTTSDAPRVPEASRTAKPYDPLEAQLREILNSQSEWLIEESSRIEEASRSLRLDDVGRSVSAVTQGVVRSLVTEGRSVQELLDHDDLRDLILRSIDRTSYAFGLLTRALASVRSVLLDNGASSAIHGDARHSGKSRRATIRAASALLLEFGDRAKASDSPPFLVSYGEYFTATQISRWFEPLAHYFPDLPEIPMLPDVVSLPDWCSGRLGALPVLAHEAGHVISDQLSEVPLKGLFGEVERTHFSCIAANHDEREWSLALRNWTYELAADLLGCALCGPAYLFAFARFALGHLHSIDSGTETSSQTHPRTASRLRTCEWALQQWGFEVQLQSRFLPDDVQLLIEDESILRSVREAIRRPYEPKEHAKAVGDVAAALHRGELVIADPTLLLNALWHSVVNKTGYANEIALAYSLLGPQLRGPAPTST